MDDDDYSKHLTIDQSTDVIITGTGGLRSYKWYYWQLTDTDCMRDDVDVVNVGSKVYNPAY